MTNNCIYYSTSIDTVDATLAKIDYSIKEIQTLQNIQKLEREIERALDMHGIRDSSLALLRGFHLRYTMRTQKVKRYFEKKQDVI